MRYKKIRFPKDGKPHKNIVEWWYFNGHLNDKKGNQYAFMNCLFKVDPRKINLPFLKMSPIKNFYFSHHLLSDIKKKKFYSHVNPVVIISKDSFSKELFFINYTLPSYNGYVNYEIEEIDNFKYRIKTDFFDFVLTPKKRPLLLGGKGFLNSNAGQTYYYSLTNLQTEGTIVINGKSIKVKGKSWMDHQWADVPYSKAKWSWFSIQLDNNTEIVCYEFIHRNKKNYLASLIDKNGKCEHTSDVILTPLNNVWESKETGAKYTLSWNIKIPSKKIDINVTPLIKTQEIIFGSINYWEGPIKVKGSLDRRKVDGKGFMELVGYPMTKSLISQYNTKFKKILSNQISNVKEKAFNYSKNLIE